MGRDVARLLSEGLERGLLAAGASYPKAALLDAFRALGASGVDAERAFATLREVARGGGRVSGVAVTGIGAGRGRRYRLARRARSGGEDDDAAVAEAPSPRSRGLAAKATEGRARSGDDAPTPGRIALYFGDNLPILAGFPDASFELIYIDPPFNTGRAQAHTRVRTVHDEEGGDRTGFQGKRYRTVAVGTQGFDDAFEDFLAFIEPRLREARRLLTPSGSLLLHLDQREVHYCKVLLDGIFGRDAFMNEIIWAYDYGGRSRRRWPAKHDNILWYVRDPGRYTFRFDAMDRIPYMAPGLVGREKAARGKTPTDVWWHTIVPTSGAERTGYPTQKPLGVLNRIIGVHSNPGDRVLDFFAGSGTTGEAAARLGRSCTLIDDNPEAMAVMTRRLAFASPTVRGWDPAAPPDAPTLDAPG